MSSLIGITSRKAMGIWMNEKGASLSGMRGDRPVHSPIFEDLCDTLFGSPIRLDGGRSYACHLLMPTVAGDRGRVDALIRAIDSPEESYSEQDVLAWNLMESSKEGRLLGRLSAGL
jgi:hypothetical protein